MATEEAEEATELKKQLKKRDEQLG